MTKHPANKLERLLVSHKKKKRDERRLQKEPDYVLDTEDGKD